MTTITFERSGGVVGNQIYFDLDLENMSEDKVARVQKLIENADFFNIPSNLAMSASTDEFQYKITVNNGGEFHSVHTTDTTMPRALLPLIRELTMLRILNRKPTEA